MKLYELHKLFSDTNDDYWNVLEIGTYYHDTLSASHSSSGTELEVDRHDHRAVLLDDVDVAIEWGMHSNDRDDDVSYQNYQWSKAAHWPDAKVVEEFVDVFYRGSLVDRIRLISVDGHRATLPLPYLVGEEWMLRGLHVDVARLVDNLSGRREFETYLSGFDLRTLR